MADRSGERDGVVVVGRLATLLAGTGEDGLADGLNLLVEALGLRSAVLRDHAVRRSGTLRAVAGEVVRRVGPAGGRPVEAVGPTVELPVSSGGRALGTLTVVGARPSQLPALRSAAAVFALLLARDPDRPAADLPRRLLVATEADRDALADELHDGPVQALVAARYAADAGVRGGDPAVARDAVQSALVELRRALWQVRPRGADGLAAALRALAERLAEAGGPLLDVAADPLADLSGPAAQLAYRVVQSAARAHAGAGGGPALRLVLRAEGDRSVLDLDGAALPDPSRWLPAVQALNGTLSGDEHRLRLALPGAPPPAPRTLPAPPPETRRLPTPPVITAVLPLPLAPDRPKASS